MKHMSFTPVIWEKVQTEVLFIPSTSLNPTLPSKAINILLMTDTHIVLVKPSRGWGIIAGHIESGESPQDTAIREAFEEAGAVVSSVKLIGYLTTTKIKENELNQQYPKLGSIPTYISNDFTLSDTHSLDYETTERAFIPFADISLYIYEDNLLEQLVTYVRSDLKSSD